MIQLLAAKYQKHIAYGLGCIFYLSIVIPSYAVGGRIITAPEFYDHGTSGGRKVPPVPVKVNIPPLKKTLVNKKENNDQLKAPGMVSVNRHEQENIDKADIDGPSQPEMSSFKPAGTNDMVNLFTGDFSYNIPLLDVGGYPVNIFYDGGISMEQEASWVGLGWNINPGNINRNMRGVPDDFNGEEKLVQEQAMKPNKTWGVRFGGDYEFAGKKDAFGISLGTDLGVSFNNYLGPALDVGVKGGVSITVAKNAFPEKSAADSFTLKVGAGVGVNASSRYGMTISPNISLTAKFFKGSNTLSNGLKLSTDYNSRIGIKALQISDQTTFNRNQRLAHIRITPYGDIKSLYDNYSQSNTFLLSSSISFNRPSYLPAMRAVVTNEAFSGHFQYGVGFGLNFLSAEAEVYTQKSSIVPEDMLQTKPMIGYMYSQKSQNNKDAIMDFTRVNDDEVTPTTPIISAPQYTFDVFSIQGEGTSGNIRAYRNDVGYMRDKYTTSKDKSTSIGLDVGPPGHYGANFNTISTPTILGDWGAGNKLRSLTGFSENNGTNEFMYFRNPGESSVIEPGEFDLVGGTDLVRVKLGGNGYFPTIEPSLERLTNSNAFLGNVSLQNSVINRKKRTQVISFLTAEEASNIGLDKKIKNYDPVTWLDGNNKLKYTEIERVGGERKGHHISQINVTEADGKRYVYGLPVYNLLQKDFSFTVNNTLSNQESDKIGFSPGEASTSSPHIVGNTGKDGFVQITTTPAYAHSFLLSGLLSPDYVDITGDGITEDDLGTAVKFNYSKYDNHRWRTPLSNTTEANLNAGNRSEIKDDKGIISYGDRESWYLQSIESKTMIAFFTTESRNDGKGALDPISGGRNSNDNSSRLLHQIDLYNKADLKKNGLGGAKPVKTVHFEYNYSLCPNTPDNTNSTDNGKLTLTRIWFTYNGQTRNNKNQYLFSYSAGSQATQGENPNYSLNGSDRWGNYKPAINNPGGMKNGDYPYSEQTKTIADQNAAPWMLRKILLPSGGQIEVQYESDDYAFVQNKRAAIMSGILGFSNTPNNPTANLYSISGNDIVENNYAFIKVPVACSDKTEVFQRYLDGITQLAFKLAVKMPKIGSDYRGTENLLSYAEIEDYDVYTGAGFPAIWIKLKKVSGISPLSLTAIDYLREHLPGQAFPGYDVSESQGLKQIGEMLAGLQDGLKSAFKDIVKYLRTQGKAQTADLARTFVRINDPDGIKLGGGYRVKSIKLRDNWDRMTQQYGSVYGQEYDYTTSEIFNGVERIISSGVASYEPSLGGEENPFQTVLQVSNKLPLGPASYGAIEMPVLDAFFPSAIVGYSKVTVNSIGKKQNPDPANKKTRSAVGKQVTEFYTAKDFPLEYHYSSLDPSTDKQQHKNSLTAFLYKYAFDSRAISQGFIVMTNDMHGKMKSQSSYAENDPNTRINYTENFYRNTGVNGLNEKFDFAYNNLGGEVKQGNMGVDVELMTDAREFSVMSNSLEIQGQVDAIPFPPFWLPFIWPVAGNSTNTYRAVTTTKVINYHSVLDSVLVIDKGSKVSTKNLVYDAETGQVLVNRTNNEFDKAIYSVTYPAYWAYSGMGLAYKNIDAIYSGVNFLDGKIVSSNVPGNIFESGDELYIIDAGSSAGCDPIMNSPGDHGLIWVLDKNKNSSSLTDIAPDLIFIDKDGKPYSRSGVKFRIVRSGHRNILGASLAGITMMNNPVVLVSPGVRKLAIDNNSRVVNATAVEFKEKWQADNDVFYKYKTVIVNPSTCTTGEVEDCSGFLEQKINPYRKGLLGNFRGFQNMVFYGERLNNDPLTATNLPVNGFLKDFSLYWNFNSSNNLIPDHAPASKWVWNTLSTRYNAKGLELETKDALGIYTAAQYGYGKTIPIAITNNSRFDNMVYDGFEDSGYEETLNGAVYNNCSQKHFDFSAKDYGQIVIAHNLGFNAHTGKYVLQVNNELHKNIAINSSVNDVFQLQYQPGTSESLIGAGQNFFRVEGCESNTSGQVLTHTVGINDYLATGFEYCPDYLMKFYVQAPSTGSFPFTSFVSVNGGSYEISIYLVTDINSAPSLIYNYTEPAGDGPPSHIDYTQNYFNVQMCAGKYYLVQMLYHPNPIFITPPYDYWPHGSTSFWSGVTCDVSLPIYENIQAMSGICNYTKPIPATESMMNPTFSIPSNKKMVFSAWVRESCGDPQSGIPCNKTTYTDNEVQVSFGTGNSNNVTIKPTGPIIEGWQRYEGYFTAPPGASTMDLIIVNNSGSPVYFDDIRIHPFNSNMKSFVYDPVNLRLVSELDANNYASFYEYDEEGTLIRTKVETREGVKTVTESRSAKQKNIVDFQ